MTFNGYGVWAIYRFEMARALLEALNIGFKDLNTRQSSLEDIFVSLVHQNGAAA